MAIRQHLRYLQKPFCVTLISRRSAARAGPRFYSRGIDDAGNVANFVETEVTSHYDNDKNVFSHVQIRGSVPLFWSQKAKKSTKVNFKGNILNKFAFDKHFD